jgi:hypothetical protein
MRKLVHPKAECPEEVGVHDCNMRKRRHEHFTSGLCRPNNPTQQTFDDELVTAAANDRRTI